MAEGLSDDEIGERIEALLEQGRKVIDTNLEYMNRLVKPDGEESVKTLTLDDWAIRSWDYWATMTKHSLETARLVSEYAVETLQGIRGVRPDGGDSAGE